MYFEHDLESNKLNIFTGGKAAWAAMPEAVRSEIKRFCLWSRTRECWVSKSHGDNAYWLRKTLTENGFEDRGKVGEKLSIEERIERQRERAEERAERYENRRDAAAERSDALANRSREMMAAIPMGQPILVGHYSEKRDRNYRDRAWNMMGKACSESDKAKYYAGRAATARETADGAKYSDPSYLGNRIKESEAEIRTLELRLQGKSYTYSEPKPISDEYRARIEGLLAEQREELGFFQHCLETCGRQVWNKETLKGKAEVNIRGRWEPIVRLNPTTVAVPNICFPDPEHQRKYALKYQYTEVRDAR